MRTGSGNQNRLIHALVLIRSCTTSVDASKFQHRADYAATAAAAAAGQVIDFDGVVTTLKLESMHDSLDIDIVRDRHQLKSACATGARPDKQNAC
jgi:hypothetical protein